MSSKRQRSKARSKRDKGDAIPAEILAEGSGPNEVVDATPQTLVEAAEELVDKRKGRKKKGKAAKQDDAAEPVVAAETSEDTTEPDSEATLEASDNEEAATDGESAEVEATADSDAELEATSDGDGDAEVEATGDENPDEALAFDAAADNVPADTTLTGEGETVAAVEDAIMRAEAEAELGAAEDIDGETAEVGEDGEAALPTTAATMDAAQLKNLVEALVFAADKPVTLQRLRQLTRVGDVKRLEQALTELAADYTNRGLVLQQVSGGYQFRTNTQYSVWVQQLIAGRPVRLSRAQLETLAIVAYRQPITRPEIDEIRGVDSSATLRLLLDRSLIRTLGKKEDVGRPMLYGTTKEFLDFFSLGDLRELPTLREYSELTAESRKVMTDRLGVDPGAEPANDEAATEEAVEAKPTVEVDAWGQVINVPDEAATDTSDSEVAADADASGETEMSATDIDASGTESTDTDESAELSDDEASDAVEMSSSSEATDSDEPAETPRVLVDAWGQPISTDDESDAVETSASEDASSESDEVSASDESSREGELSTTGADVSAETDEVSASEESSSNESASEELSASEDSSNDETSAANAMSTSAEDVSAETEDQSASEESSSEGELSTTGEDVSAETDEMSASEESTGAETSSSDEMSTSAEDVSAETEDRSASEEMSASSDESSVSDEQSMSEDSSSESAEMSTSEESSSESAEMSTSEESSSESDEMSTSEESSSESEDLGAPAGGTMEDRIDLAGAEGDGDDLDAASAEEASVGPDSDEESLEASADVVAAEKLDASDDEPGDEPSRD